MRETKTDSQGNYVFPAQSDSSWLILSDVIALTSAGELDYYSLSGRVPESQICPSEVNFTIRPNTARLNLVVTKNGVPQPGQKVSVFLSAVPLYTDFFSPEDLAFQKLRKYVSWDLTTNKSGQIKVTNLPPGDYTAINRRGYPNTIHKTFSIKQGQALNTTFTVPKLKARNNH